MPKQRRRPQTASRNGSTPKRIWYLGVQLFLWAM